LWGSNATNGIINIITRQSVDTQGVRAQAKVGAGITRAELGYGRQLSDSLGLRLYGDYRYERGLEGVDGRRFENWRKGGMIGARVDFAPDAANSMVALAEFSRSDFVDPVYVLALGPTGLFNDIATPQQRHTGYHTLARWHHAPSSALEFSLQGYFNRYERSVWGSRIARDLVDLSLEGRWRSGAIHEFNFGLTARQSHDNLTPGPMLLLKDGHHTDRWLTGYLQDEIRLKGEDLRFTLGSKFEINNFTPLIVQPSARLFWRASPKLSLWSGISHAMRTPQLRERGMLTGFPSLQNLPGIGTVPVIFAFRAAHRPNPSG
jgi:iron complex outermembrane receptor protein